MTRAARGHSRSFLPRSDYIASRTASPLKVTDNKSGQSDWSEIKKTKFDDPKAGNGVKKQGKLYILCWFFSYGAASSNRLLAYANSASKAGVDVSIVTLVQLDLKDCHRDDSISINGLSSCRIKSKVLAFLMSIFTLIWFLLFTVKKQDRILLYASPEYLPICMLFRRKQTYHEITECPELYPPKYPFFMYKRLWKKVKGLIVISANLKDYFVSHGVNPEHVPIVNMTVDITRFCNIPQDDSRGKYIAYCGNVYKDDNNKDGVEDLIKAFVIYHEEYHDRKLYIIGPILSENQKQIYLEYLKRFHVEDAVVFTGSVSPNDIPSLLANAEMLVLARPDNIQAKYGFPTKLGEYLLTSKPCVLTDVGNICDFLEDGISAYIATPGDVKSIAKQMQLVSSDTNRALRIGAAGKNVALKSFNSDIETNKLLRFMQFN